MSLKTILWIVGGLVAVVALVFLFKGCNMTGQFATGTTPSVPTTIIKSGDSVTIRQQEVVILQSQETIEALQDSLEQLTEKLTGVKPQYIIRYKDTLRMKDTLHYAVEDPYLVDSLETALGNSQGKIDSFLKSRDWIPVPKKFIDSGAFFNIRGSVTWAGVNIDNLEVYNNTSVTIGQKSSLLSTGPIVVNVSNDNPMLKAGTLQTYYYQPKVRKWTLVVGPSVLFNGKSFSEGVAITGGYRLW